MPGDINQPTGNKTAGTSAQAVVPATHIDYSKLRGTYTADYFGGHEGLAAVRARPTVNLDSVDMDGLIHQFREVIENSIDETYNTALALGITLTIDIDFLEDGSVRIIDKGRGITGAWNEKFNMPVLQAIYGCTSFGGKGYTEKEGYKVSAKGRHGTGAAVSCALSEFFDVTSGSNEDEKVYHIRFEKGEIVTPMETIGTLNTVRTSGVTVHYKYDNTIFQLTDGHKTFDYPYQLDRIINLIKSYCYCLKNIIFKVSFKKPNEPVQKNIIDCELFNFENLMKQINTDFDTFVIEDKVSSNPYTMTAHASWGYNKKFKMIYCNGLRLEKGTHENSFNVEIDRAIEAMFKNRGVLNQHVPLNFSSETMLAYILSLDIKEPLYRGQAKFEFKDATFGRNFSRALSMWLVTPEGRKFLNKIYAEKFHEYSARLKQYEKTIKAKEKQAKALVRTEKLSEDAIDKLIMSKKMVPLSDLIIVEGESAGETVKHLLLDHQALLPIKGLFPNVNNKTEDRLKRVAIYNILLEYLNHPTGDWRNIIIMTDPDPDGGRIEIQLLALIKKKTPRYFRKDAVKILRTPLYMARNDARTPIFNEEQRKKYNIQHHTIELEKNKGIGSMSALTLAELLKYDEKPELLWDFNFNTLSAGFDFIDKITTTASYRQTYIISKFATDTVRRYYAARPEKKKTQRVKFNGTMAGFRLVSNFSDIINEKEIVTNEDLFFGMPYYGDIDVGGHMTVIDASKFELFSDLGDEIDDTELEPQEIADNIDTSVEGCELSSEAVTEELKTEEVIEDTSEQGGLL